MLLLPPDAMCGRFSILCLRQEYRVIRSVACLQALLLPRTSLAALTCEFAPRRALASLHSLRSTLLQRSCATTMARFVLTPETITHANMALRFLQCAGSLITMATVAAGFTSNEQFGNTYRLGSHESNFMLLVGYSGMLYAGWFLGFVELCPLLALRPRTLFSRAADVLFAFFLFCAAVALAASDYVRACSDYGPLLQCSNLKTSVAFAFLTIVPFLGSIALTFATTTADTDVSTPPADYCVEVTPTNALSPIGGVETPSAKV